MKKMILFLVMFCQLSVFSQTYHWQKKDPPVYAYVSGSFDVNKLFHLKENPRTEKQNSGLDYDFEIGARDHHVSVFLYYGRFDAIDYQNYGIGSDYFIHFLRDYGIEFSIGGTYGSVLLKLPTGKEGETGWANFLGYSLRAKTMFWIVDDLAIELKFQQQERKDINRVIYEGTAGIIYKLN